MVKGHQYGHGQVVLYNDMTYNSVNFTNVLSMCMCSVKPCGLIGWFMACATLSHGNSDEKSETERD